MLVCLAQIHLKKGDIATNLQKHKGCIRKAVESGASAVFFPELSLTGYEPELAKRLAFELEDSRLKEFHEISDKHNITLGIGLPTTHESQVLITMSINQPGMPMQYYSKQQLHSDELPYFGKGTAQVLISCEQLHLAPAICYESLQEDHASQAQQLGAQIYLASVAKPQRGVESCARHYPKIATTYGMSVMMVNSVGYCNNFMSAGQSSVWNKSGVMLGKLNNKDEGLLFWEMETDEIRNEYLG